MSSLRSLFFKLSSEIVMLRLNSGMNRPHQLIVKGGVLSLQENIADR